MNGPDCVDNESQDLPRLPGVNVSGRHFLTENVGLVPDGRHAATGNG